MLMEARTLLPEIYFMIDYTLERVLGCERKRKFLVGETEKRKETKKTSENKKKSIRESGINRKKYMKNIYIIRSKERIKRKEDSGIKNKIPPVSLIFHFLELLAFLDRVPIGIVKVGLRSNHATQNRRRRTRKSASISSWTRIEARRRQMRAQRGNGVYVQKD